MDEHRNELDAWLSDRVQPMLPPPGTFPRIQREARRRRRRRAALSVASVTALAAVAAVGVPQLVTVATRTGRPAAAISLPARPVTASPRTHPATPTPTPTVSPATIGPAIPVRLALSAVTSVTFVGTLTGWVLGRSLPGPACGRPAGCVSLARTDDGGRTWRPVSAPLTHGPAGPGGVSQVRFLNLRDGWAFGPQLWSTHNAGRTWQLIRTGGRRVTGLETRGTRAYAVWARCTGAGTDFAAHCSDFTVYSTPARSDHWTPVPGTQAGFSLPGAPSSAALTLTGSSSYLLAPNGILFTGPATAATGSAAWRPATGTVAPIAAPCQPGTAQPTGQPASGMLAATGTASAAGSPTPLALLCASQPAGAKQHKVVYYSIDGGQVWQASGSAPVPGIAASFSGSPAGALILAGSQGIQFSLDDGATWHQARSRVPPGGFAYVGMTTALQGVALPADPTQHALWITYDGARSWREVRFG